MTKRHKQWWRWLAERPWVLIILLAALVPLTWFAGAYLVTGTDINFPLDPLFRFTSRFSLWDQSFITGRDQSVALPTQIFAGVQALLALIGLGNTLVEKFELVFWLAASGISAAFFLSQLLAAQKPTVKKWGITLGLTVYLFNLFLVNRINEIDVATLGAYVLVPALLGFGLTVLHGYLKPWKAGLGAALVSVLGVGLFANPSLVFVITLFLVAFTLLVLITHDKTARIDYLTFLGVFALAFALVHLWWLVPYIGSLGVLVGGNGGLSNLNLLDWVDGVSRNTSFWNVLRMQGAWDWYEVGIADKPYFPAALTYQSNILFVLLSLLLPIGAILSIRTRSVLSERSKLFWWLFAATLMISLIYSMGTNNPISRWLYDTTANTVPFFWLIRSPWYKFGYLTALTYSALFAFLGVWLATVIKNTRARTWTLTAITLGIIVYAFPFLPGTNALFPYTRLDGVPDYVFEATNYLNQQPDTHRLVTLPQEEAYNYTWGYGSGGDVLGHLLRRPILSTETFAGGNRTGSDLLLDTFYQSLYDTIATDSVRLLDYLDGHWFTHKNDSKYADYGESDSPEFIRQRIDEQRGIEFDRSIGEWDMYQRTNEPPGRIYASTRLWTIFGNTQDNVKALPYLLEHLPTDDQPAQLYIRSDTAEADPGTTRQILTKDLPIIQSDSLIKKVDFDAPFAGTVTAERLVGSASGTIDLNGKRLLDGGTGELRATDNTLQASEDILPNIIQNPTFSQEVELGFPGPGPWEFSDSSKTAPGEARFDIQRVPGSDNTPALQLKASNHILALHQEVDDFEPRSIYRLSFDYRHVQGQPPSFATWQLTSAVDEPNATLEPSSDWQHYETFISTNIRSTGLLIYFYAGAELGETTINQYDNIRVEKVGTRTTFALLSEETDFAPAPEVAFTQHSPTRWTATVQPSQSDYLLTFLETFHPGWVAEVDGNQVSEADHVRVNNYANGWWIAQHDEPAEIVIHYAPQRTFNLIGWTSIVALGVIIVVLWKGRNQTRVAQSKKRKYHKKRGR